MKHLHGNARATVEVPIDACLAFLAALEAYPSWYPDVVRKVEVVEMGKDGLPRRAETKLHLSWGPVSRDLDLLLAVRVQKPGLVQLSHVPRGQSTGASFDATWQLDGRAATELELELDATMPVPGLVPLVGVGDAFADGFIEAAVRGLSAGS
ncbi:MAG TPA: hypothetical protein VMI13_04505 [Solirubrobacteraceae bacterium]|nr:hypothetical protein [Solirubrobacteraceae bacterium]